MAYTDTDLLSKLTATRDNLVDIRLLMSKSPKPTYDIDGQKISWQEYFEMLSSQIAALEKEIADNEGPFELETIGYV